MENNNNISRGVPQENNMDNERREKASSVNDDLKDSKRDEERLQPDQATLDLPDVSDIPGQEHVHVPPLGELGDTTIASDDEEADKLLRSDNE